MSAKVIRQIDPKKLQEIQRKERQRKHNKPLTHKPFATLKK